jgi:ketosteroid isomerase-like protein
MPRVPIAAPVIISSSPSTALAALERAVHTSNLENVVSWYTDDAVLMPPNEPPVVGKAAIRSRYAELFARMKLTARYEVDEERTAGMFGSLRGRMVGTRSGAAGAEDQDGKFLMLFRRDRGRWLIASMIWNADR